MIYKHRNGVKTAMTTEEEAEYLANVIDRTTLVPQIITMRQARLALIQSGLLTTVNDAIVNGTDEEMKVEWEYATEVKRDWESLIAMTASLGMTEIEVDELFILGATL